MSNRIGIKYPPPAGNLFMTLPCSVKADWTSLISLNGSPKFFITAKKNPFKSTYDLTLTCRDRLSTFIPLGRNPNSFITVSGNPFMTSPVPVEAG